MSLSHFCRLEGWLGTPPRFVFHESVSSTHDVLRELAEHGAPEGTVVLAEVQTAGRGRLGRQWSHIDQLPAGFAPEISP
ncbi:MAG TPA: hypothetical protein PLD43_12220, partial [Anaerolineae bacterium]|nr:hypothetical protein [Anaerolineae bacterium]